jgi:hypothetical protein
MAKTLTMVVETCHVCPYSDFDPDYGSWSCTCNIVSELPEPKLNTHDVHNKIHPNCPLEDDQ